MEALSLASAGAATPELLSGEKVAWPVGQLYEETRGHPMDLLGPTGPAVEDLLGDDALQCSTLPVQQVTNHSVDVPRWPSGLTTPSIWAKSRHTPDSLYVTFANARAAPGPAGHLSRLQLPDVIYFFVRVKFQRVGYPFPPGISKRYLHKAQVVEGVEGGPVAQLTFDERHVIGLQRHQHLTFCQLVLEVPSTTAVNPTLHPSRLSFHPCHGSQLHLGGGCLQMMGGTPSHQPKPSHQLECRGQRDRCKAQPQPTNGRTVHGTLTAAKSGTAAAASADNALNTSSPVAQSPRLIVPVWPVLISREAQKVPERPQTHVPSFIGTFGTSEGRMGPALAPSRVAHISRSASAYIQPCHGRALACGLVQAHLILTYVLSQVARFELPLEVS